MKKILNATGYNLYNEFDSPEILARKILGKFYEREVSVTDLPIDPFKILKLSGANYLLTDFGSFEGFYLLPEDLSDANSVAVVGINKNTRISRQRFTAAHELCHHVKDKEAFSCLQGDNDPIEVYANKFASELLIPSKLLLEILKKNQLSNTTSDKDFLETVLKISVEFGVSFQATLIKVLNYVPKQFSQKIPQVCKKFKPEKKMKAFGLSNDYILYKQIFDSMVFTKWNPSVKIQNDFLRLLITNDHRMENGKLEVSEISEIIARIRYSPEELISQHSLLNDDQLDVLGQYNMYDRVFVSLNGKSAFTELILLHKELYKYARFPEAGGSFRTASARIAHKAVKTNEPHEIPSNVYRLTKEFEDFLNIKADFSNSDILELFLKHHHEFTVIHPFVDGNGRTSRAYMNKKLFTIGIPLVYVENDKKMIYQNALEKCDNQADYQELFIFFVKNVIDVYDHIALID